MKKTLIAAGLMMAAFFASAASAEVYDLSRDFTCDQPSSGAWYFEGYREADRSYLPMVYGHPDIKEVSKYGVNAHYLPDGKQAWYPFVTKLDKYVLVSPATSGEKHDAVIAWEAPSGCKAEVSGSVKLLGNIKGEAGGKKIRAKLVHGKKVLWNDEISDGAMKSFNTLASMKKGEKINLHIENAGDSSANLAVVDFKVETP